MLQDRDQSISGMSITMMMQFMPLLEETKLEMYTELMNCTMAVFKDKTVMILMVLITIFDLESDVQIKRLRDSYLIILKRYLVENTKNDADFDMKNILKCIKALPKVYKIFMDMSDTQKESKQGSLLSIT